MCQTATQRTLVRWTRCTMTTQNFKTLLFPLTLVLHLQITRLLAALTAASRVSVLQGSAVASAHQGRSGYLFGSCRLMISRISHLCQSHFQRERANCTVQGGSCEPSHPLTHYSLRLPCRQNHVWTHRWPWRNCLCSTCSYLVCSYR